MLGGVVLEGFIYAADPFLMKSDQERAAALKLPVVRTNFEGVAPCAPGVTPNKSKRLLPEEDPFYGDFIEAIQYHVKTQGDVATWVRFLVIFIATCNMVCWRSADIPMELSITGNGAAVQMCTDQVWACRFGFKMMARQKSP